MYIYVCRIVLWAFRVSVKIVIIHWASASSLPSVVYTMSVCQVKGPFGSTTVNEQMSDLVMVAACRTCTYLHNIGILYF